MSTKNTGISLLLFVLFASVSSAQNINTPNKLGPLGTQVNTNSGNFFVPRTDMYVPARMLPLDISFYYNSFVYDKDNGFGNGWSFEYDIRYKKFVDDSISITWGDGREDHYIVQAGGFKSPQGFFSQLNEYQTGKYLLAQPDGTKYYFDNAAHRKLTKIERPGNNSISFTYTDTLLSSLSNNAGQSISFVYTAGRLTTVTDAMASPARTVTYSYDNVGNLSQVTDPLGGVNKYTYLTNGPMKTISDKNSNTIDIIYHSNFMVSELIGCIKRISFSYDDVNHITIVTDHLADGTNQVTRYGYKKFGDRTWLTSISGNCCGFNMGFEFDDNGNKIKETDAMGNTYTYTYDAKGNLLTSKDPAGNISAYAYSSDYNRMTSYTDPRGNLHALTYDGNGNLTQISEPDGSTYQATYNANGDILTSTDPRGNVYTYTYDAYGFPVSVSGPNGAKATFSFDARGHLISKTDARNNTYTAEYDLLSRVKKLTDPLGQQVKLTYDAEGNMLTVTNQNSEVTQYNYDAANRPIGTTDALGKTNSFSYDAMDNVTRHLTPYGNETRFSYDIRNRLTEVTDAEGNKTTMDYDANGHITSVIGPNGHKLTKTWDNLGRIIRQQDDDGVIGSVTYDQNSNVISYTNSAGAVSTASYDNLNRVKTITDPLGNTEKWSYDGNNNIISYTDKNGNTTTATYDSSDRPRSYTNNNGGTVTIGYDVKGNMTSVQDQNNNTTSYAYDVLDRVIRKTYPGGSFEEYTYDKKDNIVSRKRTDGAVTSYEYDSLNQLTRKSFPDGTVATYKYDAIGRLIEAANNNGAVQIAYDAMNRVVSETFDNHTTQYNYNIAGRIATMTYPDGSTVTRSFDRRNRLVSIAQGNNIIVTYQYDNSGHITGRVYGNGISTINQFDLASRQSSLLTGNIQNTQFSFNKVMHKTAVAGISSSEEYTYDDGHRLTGYKKMNGSTTTALHSYTYDAAGNRTAAMINGSSYTYGKNNLNQLLSSISGSGTINFTYDNNGNLTYDGHFFKRYDAEGKLLVDSASVSNKISYRYDALGRRIQKAVNGTAFNYYYSYLSQIELRDANTDTVVNKTVFSNFLSPVMSVKSNQQYYYHPNDMHSVEAITNSTGGLVEKYQYDAYGRTTIYDGNGSLISSSLAGNRFGFTGQEYDSETESYHFYFRNYSPVTGVFNQRDPSGYADEMGLYQYAGNNPANGIDIMGLKPCPPDEVQETTDQVGHQNNWVGILNYLLALKKEMIKNGMTFKEGEEWASKHAGKFDFASKLSVQSQVGSLILQVNSLIKESPYLTDREYNIRQGEIRANLLYLSGDLAGMKYPESAVAESYAKAMGTIGAIDGLSQELTGKSLSRRYQELDEPSIKVANRWLDQAKARYEMDARRIDTYKKLFGEDRDKWDQDMKDLYERHQNAAKQYKKTELGVYKEGMDPNKDCPPSGNGGVLLPPPGPRNLPHLIGLEILHSWDPNEMIGPDGIGDQHWVSVKDRMPYTVLFENDKSASAPAKRVRVTTPIEPKEDASTFQLGDFGFNSLVFSVPANTSAYYQRVNALDSLGLYVDVTAGYDQINNVAFWEFQSIDPVTLLPPSDPFKGFLLLPDSLNPTHGHGFVSFSIKPILAAHTGDTISAHASIVFDQNDTIGTNFTKNTIDALPPTSIINNTVTVINQATVRISWHGQDDPGGVGLESYSLYMSVNGAPFVLYRADMSDTSLVFHGSPGVNYCFYTTAKDSVGNEEHLKNGCLLSVHMGPGPLPVTLLFFNTVRRDDDALLTWATASEINSKYFSVERSLDGSHFTEIGTVDAAGYSSGIRNYTYTDRNITGLGVKAIYYRLKQVDIDGHFVYSRINLLRLEDDLNAPVVNVFPNPFGTVINLQVIPAANNDQTDAVELYTVYGTQVYRKEIGKKGTITMTLNDLPFLNSGVYILRTTVNGKQYTSKIVKN